MALPAAPSRDENSGAARVIHRQGRLCYYAKSASGKPPKAGFRSAARTRPRAQAGRGRQHELRKQIALRVRVQIRLK